MPNSEKKSKAVQGLISETIKFLEELGIPLEALTPRRAERTAMVFLAVGDIKKSADFKTAKSMKDGRSAKTRDIIKFVNQNFQENISSGSYDDIRRKDLKLLVLDGLVERTHPNSARNDSTRGYALNDELAVLLGKVGERSWNEALSKFKRSFGTVKKKLAASRSIKQIPIVLPSGQKLDFSAGKHNVLQKEIIENFLPRFGYGAEILYVGDAADKFLFLDKEKLKELRFFEIAHGELPDVLAYSARKNWIFLIEAVFSSGPISPVRMIELKQISRDCSAELVFITAFLDKSTFRRFSSDIAWESEVWIAENPDHLIHFNGSKFLGPYQDGQG
jgi:type II restriction enzyme